MTSAHPFANQTQSSDLDTKRSHTAEISGSRSYSSAERVDCGCMHFISTSDGDPGLDYALIQKDGNLEMLGHIEPSTRFGTLKVPPFTSGEQFKDLRSTEVTAKTARGTVSGQIETIPDFLRLPGARRAREVYAVTFTGDGLKPGDSGAWVHERETGALLGHVVAGIPEDNLAFIVPAYKVFANLEEVVGGNGRASLRERWEAEAKRHLAKRSKSS
ncbi:peptide-N4-(N-acetyl-beta- glucosaminyl)asparagine amidase [Curvularia kusanoi]|uniref:Peptide-N4-(N-acetyl-beta-glucosaminyl)asparagine amidase n=1 Tax=Curvularia kusanoi TaxID=90978 RepID=A0A9P4T9W0_CURKU|nr:peptide-N4-(N-acetyl-beta- glucosaminyl)asparagine amidase [Curvularia kusanoi]